MATSNPMPAPAVAVEIAPPAPNRSPELVAALLDACSDAVRRGPCVLARSQRASAVGAAPANEQEAEEEPKIVAVVVWSPRRDRASVEVRLVGADAEARTRDLEFSYADPQLERWRSVGFAVGMLADAAVSEGRPQRPGGSRTRQSGPTARRPATTAGPAETARDRTESDSSNEEAAEPSRRAWLDAGATTGPGFDTGNWRLGGFARAAYAAGRPFIQASFAYMVRAEDETGLSARWITAAVGAGHTILGSTRGLSLQVRGDVLLENVSVSLSAPSAPADDSGHRWLGGLRVGADGSWEAVPGVGVLLGVDLTAVTGAVNVDVAGTRTATVPAFRPCVLGGIRIALP